MSKKKLKPVPRFATEAEERQFWETHDTADYFDLSKAQRARFPNLKLPTTSISLRMTEGMLNDIKVQANKRDVPYQSLIKVWLAERLAAEAEAAMRRRSTQSPDDRRKKHGRTAAA